MTTMQSTPMQTSNGNAPHGGHLYMQTNELQNVIIHYLRSPNGTLTEVERIPTGGSGSGEYKPISGQESAPNAFEGAASVVISPDHRLLFATNGGDNSVSSFEIGENGQLTLLDVKRTGNVVGGRSGTAKSLAYAPASRTLFVLHSFGPDHIRLMSVDAHGMLTARPERHTANTPDKPERVPTMVVLSPDQRFLLVGTTFDELPHANPDGSPIIWVKKPDGTPKSIASNAPDPDGLLIFPVNTDGSLGPATLNDAGGASPFFPAFLNNRPNRFVIGEAVGNGLVMGSFDEGGRIGLSPVVQVDTSAGEPSELCWVAVSPDDKYVFATNFGYSYITSFRIDGDVLSVAKDPACPKFSGDGSFRALNGTVSSGPSDNWMSPDGGYLYQIYGNASKLMGYAVQPDGSLSEITSASIPHNSPMGLAGI